MLINFYGGSMKTKQDALDWALTYLREVVGVEIEDNEEYQKATQINEEAV